MTLIYVNVLNELNRMSVKMKKNSYKKQMHKGQIFSFNNKFSGIINHLRWKSNNNIDKEIVVTASSISNSGERYQPNTVVWKENNNYRFLSEKNEGSWLRIDLKNTK